MSSLPRLLAITNRTQVVEEGTGNFFETLRRMSNAGIELVQYREKNRSTKHQYETLSSLRDQFPSLKFLVNGRADLALVCHLTGVHSPTSGLSPETIRSLMKETIVGASTHNLSEAKAAESEGADYVTLSPIYRSSSKPQYGPPLGTTQLRRVTETIEIPVFALAGVTPERVGACLEAGAYGVAVMGGLMRSDSPGSRAHEYLRQLPGR